MVEKVEGLEWVRDVPFIGDRAMGNSSSVARLVSSGLRFLTATRVTEIATYTDQLPSKAFEDIAPIGTELSREIDIERARTTAEAAGLEKVNDLRFVKDLGICKRTLYIDCDPIEPGDEEQDPQQLEGGAAFLAMARILRRRVETKEVSSQAALAREHGLTRARITQLFNLLKLDFKLQEQVIRGDFGYVPERILRQAVRRRAPTAQRETIERHAEKGLKGGRVFQRTGPREVELRLVANFNPQMFVEQRVRAAEGRARIENYVNELNEHLRHLKRSFEEVYRDVMNRLTGANLIGLYDLSITELKEGDRTCLQVCLKADENEWRRRRRFDGFVLLIAHPQLSLSAAELVQLYYAKDAVEKDFQTIKSVVKLRPVFHHTDPKVRAHVTLCMLALLVERTLEQRLSSTPVAMSATACFERLTGCHLNLVRASPDAPTQYVLTETTQAQRAILRSLRLGELVEEEVVQVRLTPRNLV